MILGRGEEKSPSWALRAAGSEQGFVFIEGRHQSHVQDLRGLEEFSLLVSALLMGQVASPGIPASHSIWGPQHISPPCSQRAGEVGKHQKLSTEKHPKLQFTKLICGGEGCRQPQILSLSFSQPPPTRSILLHPHLGCQDVWFACKEGPPFWLRLGAPFLPHPP